MYYLWPGGVTDLYDYYPKSFYGKFFVFFVRKDVGILPKPDLAFISKDLDDIFMNLGFLLFKGDCNNDRFLDLLIGSPFSKGSEGDQIGKVHIIESLNWSNLTTDFIEILIEDVTSFELKGESNYQWFGYSVICTDNQVIIGSPGARSNNSVQSSGKVSGYN